MKLRQLLAGAAVALLGTVGAAGAVDLQFYYPVAVGGPITKIIDGYAAEFEKENPGIKIHPVYSGTYQDTIAKVLTAQKGGEAPQLAVILSTDMFTLIDEGAVVPWDEVAKGADDKKWMDGFYPAFMANSRTGGKTWGIPFQRSTVVMYWNKELYKEAGLDPEKPAQNWAELVAQAKKLTKRDASGNVTQWGVQIPSSGFPYWLFQGLVIENGANLMNQAGTEVYYDKPAVIDALQYWVDLVNKYKVHPPGTWQEMADYAQKLTKRDASGNVTQWGVQIPSSGFPYWLFQGLAIENGVNLMNEAGTQVYYDKPEVIGALQYWVDLVNKYKVHPPGIVEWGTTPKDFFERKVAMMWTTTGNLTNVKNNAKFDFGVAMLPAGKQRGSPTGGGNFYIFKKSTPAQREAAFKFIKWVTTPERAAKWGIDTGYVAVRADAWDTPTMKQYVAGFPPAAVARDQLQYAKAELSTHDNQRVTKALNDGLQAALTGTKTPEQAMKDAQREADRLLRSYK
jgi:ABC-type glycerol-3-phosphate transport system substrate-binding protein